MLLQSGAGGRALRSLLFTSQHIPVLPCMPRASTSNVVDTDTALYCYGAMCLSLFHTSPQFSPFSTNREPREAHILETVRLCPKPNRTQQLPAFPLPQSQAAQSHVTTPCPGSTWPQSPACHFLSGTSTSRSPPTPTSSGLLPRPTPRL